MTAPLTNTNAVGGADTTAAYGDFAGLEKLKAATARHDPAALRQVARQFESLFARMMIKSMRDAIGKDPIFGSNQAQTYQTMFDDQLSVELTQGKGLGLADMLMRQLQRIGGDAGSSASSTGSVGSSGSTGSTGSTGRGNSTAAAGATGSAASRSAGGVSPAAAPATPAQQAKFISQVWPQAQAAAQQLGVHPVSLVAQAALESNWGRSVPRDATGASSNNLFGIKAGSSWSGASVSARTTEVQDGVASGTSAAFRAYASPADSFQDYVALLKGNSRFSAALGSGGDVQGFARALQQGGYATDPDYAHKVTAVAGEVVASLAQNTAAATPLKLASIQPLTAGTDTL